LADLAAQIQRRPTKLVAILPVMVTGSPYPEDSEWRLRSRYALISGLNVCNFVPEDSQHIGYIRVPWPNDAGVTPSVTNDPSLIVPYEWFTWQELHSPYPPIHDTAPDDVLVLWLKDELFSDRPMLRLAGLVKPLATNRPGAVPAVTLKVMGPYGSTTLGKMVLEDSEAAISNTFTKLNTQIYSSSATAADRFLISRRILEPEPRGSRREAVTDILRSNGVQFINGTCTDKDLAKVMLEELARRKVKLSNAHHAIVMISEEDTFYGRSLPATFDLELKKYRPPNESDPFAWSVKHYTYLRGLDGKAASGEVATEKSTSADKKPDSPQGPPVGTERPENSGQLDYVRRLVDRIERDCSGHEAHARHSEKPPELKAIGILGSDVYDKLLLLQLLRKRFPNALFFTTDLDARLFHPQELKASRNVLVASTFGLQLEAKLQHDIPPFRDTYQTALFLNTCVALGLVGVDRLKELEPRLFEIGQLGAVDLSVTESGLHPHRENFGHWLDAGRLSVIGCLVPILGLIALCTVLPVRNPLTLGGPTRKRAAALLSSLGLLVLVAFTLCLYWDYSKPAGEPVLLLSGVSIWPTETVRLITTFLCFFWLLMCAQKLAQDRDKLANDFGFKGVPPKDEKHLGWLQKFRITRWKAKDSNGEEIPAEAEGKRVCALHLWQDYAYLGSPKNRIWRIAWGSLVYLAFGMAIILNRPPFVPGRGSLSFVVDRVVMMLLVIGFVFLMFAVVDATRLCARMVVNLSSYATDWRESSYREFQKLRPLPAAYLRDWMDIKFIAGRTHTVVRLIYYPFIVIFLMILSRSHFFDAWDWPGGLRIVVGLSAGFAFCCAASLRITAEQARQQALRRMRDLLVLVRAGRIDTDEPKLFKADAKVSKAEPKAAEAEAKTAKAELEKDANGNLIGRKELETELKELIEDVKSTEEGAFAPWSRQPLVGALIMPFTGAGLLALLQYLAASH
jgi:hypothetical protein